MEDRFQQMIDDDQSDEQNDDAVSAGDECPEECAETVFERHHPRNPILGAERHRDAPEVEVVCAHHGVVRSA